jgi:tRNA G18 (ribose-2'-O)-methylase SpoU
MNIKLIGDGIENPNNALVMNAAAAMFGSQCAFRDRKRLGESEQAAQLEFISSEQLLKHHPLIALENVRTAEDIYGFRTPPGQTPVLVAGNEKFGIAEDVIAHADCFVQIPMPGRRLNTINVAAASAVALYYGTLGARAKMKSRANPNSRRPEVLLLAPADHVEAGSSIRSAGAFGWDRVFVDDRNAVWFDTPRAVRTEARAAARSARNAIRVIPSVPQADLATVITTSRGIPLAQSNLARGHSQVVVIPDENSIPSHSAALEKIAKRTEFVRIELATEKFPYHYRLITAIALAECARQVGLRARARIQRRDTLEYDFAIGTPAPPTGELVFLDDLREY